uniref:Uncharacterized protein n=1 Tax=Arundo donax TaxID=35708 RepID=A0A0A9AIV6_ARUDO
MLISLRNSCS